MRLPHDWIVPDWDAPPGVRAFVTTRAGGVSDGGHASLNLGLSFQMVDDLLTLGVHHAGINLTLNGLLSPAPQAKPGQLTATADGLTFALNEKYVQSLDRQIKALSDKGVVVTAILITYRSPNERIRAVTVHPQADPVKGTTMAATEMSGVDISAMTRNSCSAMAPPCSMGTKSSL